MKKFLLTTIIFLFGISTIYSQKGRPNPNKPVGNGPTFSGNCDFILSIEDKVPAAVCSELLKTLVAVSDLCTDTTTVNYSWSSSVGGVFSNSRTTTFNLPEFIIATPLTITVSATQGVETRTANYTFTVKPRPARPILSPIGSINLCDNLPITLTSSACTGGSTTIWSNGNAGLTSIVVPPVGGTYFKVACAKDGCVSDSTAAVSLVAASYTAAPTTIDKTICEGDVFTIGNGLQASSSNCSSSQTTGTYTYSGPTVGYDQGYRNSGGIDPTVVVPNSTSVVKKVKVSITWRKQAGGFQNDCGTGNTLTDPYHNETQFRIKSPSGKIITLVNTGTYGGYSNPTVTTVFEDGATPINFYSPPVSGTFAPTQPLSGFIGENASGTWTLLPFDDYWRDPLCVSGFSVTFTADINNSITWWDAPTGGNLLGTGSEYLPTVTSPGAYTYYAQAQCGTNCPSPRVATNLTINFRLNPPVASVNVPLVSGTRSICGGESITLSATGCANNVKWSSNYYGANFATGNSYTFTPAFSNTSDINQTFTAICDGVNVCKSDISNVISINVKKKPAQPTISGPSTACLNSSVTLYASACSGGTLGWSGNRSGSSISFPISNTVNIKVACTINGCTSDSSAVYSITPLPKPAVPTVNSSQLQAICIGGSVTLSANGCTGGATVKWTGGLTGSPITITPTSTQNFRASCLGTNGCASDSSTVLNIVVLPKTKPTITGPAFVCGPSAITLNATGCSGANETVMWRDQSTGITFTDNISQTKTFRAVCIRNGYCVSDSSDIFTVQYRNKPGQATITSVGNTIVCQPASVTLSASACTGGTLGWTGGLTGSSIIISSVGTKSFKVACTINGCTSDSSAVQSITIHPKPNTPTISSSGNIVCQPHTVTLTASACIGGTLGWTGGFTGQSITISTVGTKSFKVACTINGCTSDSSLVNTIQIKAKPGQPTIAPPPNATICQGNSFTLTASACTGGTLGWTGGLTGSSITISSVGTKSFKVSCTINGCTSDSSAVQSITINPKSIFTISADKPEICEGESATLTVIGCNGTIAWSNGAGNVASITVSPTITTNYTATCTVNGCSSSQTSTVTALQTPKVTASGPLVCDQSITLTASNYPAGASIQWRKNGVDIAGATSSTLVVSEAGNYDFVVYPITSGNQKPNYALWGYVLSDLKTLNSNLGFLSVNEKIMRTSNGGSTWSDVYTGGYVYNLTFNDLNHGWAAGEGIILKTIDGGTTWNTGITNNVSTFKNIAFYNNTVGICVSTNLYTFLTSDGGSNWTIGNQIASNQTYNSLSDLIYIPNTNKLLATVNSISNNGKIFTSTDGGINWTISNDFPLLYDIYFFDSNIGWIGSNNSVYKTINGGLSWTSTNVPIGQIKSIDFVNAQIGYAFGDEKIFKTIDGGANWFLFRSILNNDSAINPANNKIDFISEDTGWFSFVNQNPFPPADLVVKKSTGIKCQASTIIVTPPANQATAITLSTDKTEICAGESATIISTACNGTLSWSNGAGNVSSIVVAPTITTTYTVTCTSGTCTKTAQITITPLQTPKVTASGPLVCDQSITLTASNYPAGASIQWRKDIVDIVGATNTTLVVNEPGNYDFEVGSLIELKKQVPKNNLTYNIKFLNKNLGFLISNKIEKTIDGGHTWETKYSLINDAFTDIKFIDNIYGWAVSYSKILRTIDGGNNWIEFDLTLWGLAPNKISFMDNKNGIVIFYGGKTAYTIDGGISWQLNSNTVSNFNTIGIEYKNNVILCVSDFSWSGGGGGRVRKSIDKGLSWEIVKDIFLPCFSFQMVNNNLGFIGTYNGLFKTTDSGNTWIENIISGSNWIRSISFVNNQTGYMIDYDKIYKTSNGGNLWEIYKSFPRDNNLYNQVDQKIEFVDDKNGYFIQNATDPNYIIQDYYIQLFKISTPLCPTIPAIVSPIPRPAGPLVINTFKSGPWTDASTWSCGFIPSSLDEVIINAGHTVTDTGNTLNAKKLKFNGNGTLQLAPTTNLRLSN